MEIRIDTKKDSPEDIQKTIISLDSKDPLTKQVSTKQEKAPTMRDALLKRQGQQSGYRGAL